MSEFTRNQTGRQDNRTAHLNEAFELYAEGAPGEAMTELLDSPEMADWWPAATLAWLASRDALESGYVSDITDENLGALRERATLAENNAGKTLRQMQWLEPAALLARKCFEALDFLSDFDSATEPSFHRHLDQRMRQRLDEYIAGDILLRSNGQLPEEVEGLTSLMSAIMLWHAWYAQKETDTDEGLLLLAIEEAYRLGFYLADEWTELLSETGVALWEQKRQEIDRETGRSDA